MFLFAFVHYLGSNSLGDNYDTPTPLAEIFPALLTSVFLCWDPTDTFLDRLETEKYQIVYTVCEDFQQSVFVGAIEDFGKAGYIVFPLLPGAPHGMIRCQSSVNNTNASGMNNLGMNYSGMNGPSMAGPSMAGPSTSSSGQPNLNVPVDGTALD